MKRIRRWLFTYDGGGFGRLVFDFLMVISLIACAPMILLASFSQWMYQKYGPDGLQPVPAPASWPWHIVPEWQLVLPPAILPAIWLIEFFVRRRRDNLQKARLLNNICLQCGYDLRATPNQCPECGTIPAKKEMNAK